MRTPDWIRLHRPPERRPVTDQLWDAYRLLGDLWEDPRLPAGDFKGELARMQMRLLDEYESLLGVREPEPEAKTLLGAMAKRQGRTDATRGEGE